MLLERVEPFGPQPAVRPEPFVDRAQSLASYPIDPPLRVDPGVDEPGVSKHPEVLGHGGLAERGGVDEVADGPLGLQQQVEDASPVRLSEDGKWRGHGSYYNEIGI
jgi:hypothetical protein